MKKFYLLVISGLAIGYLSYNFATKKPPSVSAESGEINEPKNQVSKTGTIKQFKFQETSSINLVNCIINPSAIIINCNENVNSEIITVLNRRFFLPFYLPVVALICSFLLIKAQSKKNYFLNKYSIFVLGFLVLIYSELIIRFTGISKVIATLFVISPFILIPIIYLFLILKLNRESISR